MTDFLRYCKDKKIYIALILMFLYVLPLVVYDIRFDDDFARQWSGYGWHHDGRFMTTYVMRFLSLSDYIYNLAPLPLLLGIVVLSLSGYYFCYRYKVNSTLCAVIITLSVIISPFYLQNLSYQYDVLGMCLSVALAIFAGVYSIKNNINFSTGLILFIFIIVYLGFYQSAINIFISLFLFGIYNLLVDHSIKYILKKILIVAVITLIAIMIDKWLAKYVGLNGWVLSHSETVPISFSSFALIKHNFIVFKNLVLGVYNHHDYYGKICLGIFTFASLLLFKNSNIKQKLYIPVFILFMIFFIVGPLSILKNPLFNPRAFLGVISIYVVTIYILTLKLPKKWLFLPILFILIHFAQAYIYYNTLNDSYKKDEYFYDLMSLDVNNIQLPIENIKIINNAPDFYERKESLFNHNGFIYNQTVGKWTQNVIFKNRFINLDRFNGNIDNAFLTNCNNVIFYHQMYNVYVYKETVVFDYNKTCKLENKIIANQIQSGNKIELNQELKGNLVLDALIYSFNPQTELRTLTFEFNQSLFEQATKDENIFYIHIFKEGSDQFYNADRPLNQLVKINDRYYLNTSTGDIDFKDITKIDFGFYNSNAKTNSAHFSVNLQTQK